MKRLYLVFLVLFLSQTSCNEEEEEALRSFINNNLKFRAEVYKKVLEQQEGNVFFSPMGVTFLMSFLSFGANSSTLDEIQQTLNLPQNRTHLQIAIRTLRKMVAERKQSKLHAYIKVFVKEQFPIKDEFVEQTKHAFVNCCEVEYINFLNSEAADSINQWSSLYNDTRLIVNQSEFHSKTSLLPVNPLYFAANWLHPFESANTKSRDFHVDQSKTSKVDAMETTGFFNHYESDEFNAKIIELEFDGKEGELVIILPNQRDGLKSVEEKIEQFNLLTLNSTKRKLRVVLPKFHIGTKIKLKPILNNLGIVKAFDQNQADFSSLSGQPGDLNLENIVQKAFITIDEHGIVAEASTSTPSALSLGSSRDEKITTDDFIIDHPFLFYIKLYGVALFAGRVIDPNEVELI